MSKRTTISAADRHGRVGIAQIADEPDEPIAFTWSSVGGTARTLVVRRAGRLLRFALTGGLAGTVQLTILAVLLHGGCTAVRANVIAFLLAAQVNFVLSSLFTWRDRHVSRPLWLQWLVFHGSIASMAVLNMLVFALTRMVAHDLVASAAGILAAAAGNYLLGDRLVFRVRHTGQPMRKARVEKSVA